MSEKDLKMSLYQFCQSFIDERSSRVQSQIKELQTALDSETKSSAGDKHETGRAMLQLEREKLGQQLAEVQDLNRVMQKIDVSSKKSAAALGSLVKTTNANYFLAISAGEFKAGDSLNYCISLNTPIGIMLLGKTVGNTINFNGEKIKILQIH
ncbi:MAG: 3-oxoacyl-ACP synthase [Maribacter sp.]|nr:3-oxoacyl-ACP synthase [Maribacter sp.]